jgi:hypothetical protein
MRCAAGGMSGSSAKTLPSRGLVMPKRCDGTPARLRDGCVPAMDHSSRGGSRASSNCANARTTPAGGAGRRDAAPSCRRRTSACHTGAAPLTPLTRCIASPPALPTQTPTL